MEMCIDFEYVYDNILRETDRLIDKFYLQLRMNNEINAATLMQLRAIRNIFWGIGYRNRTDRAEYLLKTIDFMIKQYWMHATSYCRKYGTKEVQF